MSDSTTAPLEKTFTQDQVNALLAKEKRDHQAALDAAVAAVVARAEAAEAKVAGYEAEKQRAEWIAEITKDSGVPAEALRGETREELQAHHDVLAPLVNPAPPVTPLSADPPPPTRTAAGIPAGATSVPPGPPAKPGDGPGKAAAALAQLLKG